MALLEVREFNLLEPEGIIGPNRLRFAQPEISRDFSEAAHGTVFDLARKLRTTPGFAANLPPVEIGEFAQRVWSFDTRRLVAFQMATDQAPRVQIRYKKLDAAGVLARLDNFDGNGSRGGIQVGIRLGGKHATRQMHVNPDFANINMDPSMDVSTAETESARGVLQVLTSGKKFVSYPPTGD